MATRLSKIIDERKGKVERLTEMGVDPYLNVVERKELICKAREMKGKKVSVVGRVMGMRGHGGLSFMDLKDGSGQIQLVLKKDNLSDHEWEIKGLLDIGDFVNVWGEVFTTKSGELSIEVGRLVLLTKTIRPLPSSFHGFKDKEERYRQRYVDMVLNPEVRERLQMRSMIITSFRKTLDEKGFVEVETPTLQPIYGGGFARPFKTHHNALDSDFYLRISDEMYLKRLIVGGMEKVYEITKVFRNEGVDHDHNPEFTMFEAQIAYENYRYGMDLVEELIENAAKKVLGKTEFTYQGKKLSVKRPWKRMSMVEAIKEHTGIDVLEWQTLEEAKEVASKLSKAYGKELKKIGTIGEVIAFVFEEEVEEKLIQPTMIYDYPVAVSPLAKKSSDQRFTQRFEMFAFGSELGNNYSELNDPQDLRQRFVEEKKREAAGFDEAHQTDEDYLRAIEYGFPPTCGLGIGIDRLVMMLTDAKNIKEVIAFPTLKPKK